MCVADLEQALETIPFCPFDIHTDGEVVGVAHAEQVFITPNKAAVFVVASLERLHAIDTAAITGVVIRPCGGPGGRKP